MSSKPYPIAAIINPSEIVIFKFILESYEGLAELRTINSEIGKILILATQDTAQEVINLTKSLNLQICIVPEKKLKDFLEGENEDWLSAELFT